MKKRIFSVLICLCLVLALAPATAFAGTGTATEAPTIQLGYDGILSGDTFFLGEEGNYPIQWYMLNTTATNALAVSKYTLGQSVFGTDYAHSALKTAMDGEYSNDFSASEKIVIKQSTLAGGTMSAESNDLTAYLYPLVLMDMASLGGFASPMSKAEPISNEDGGTDPAGPWWLRTTSSDDAAYTQRIDASGSIGVTLSTNTCGIRPAFRLDPSKIVMISVPSVGKISGIEGVEMMNEVAKYTISATSPTEWKLTILDPSFKNFKASLNTNSSSTVEAGSTIKIDYSGALLGTFNCVAALLVDSSGNVLYYGNLDPTSSSGTQEILIPAQTPAGQYTFKVYNEQWNHGKDTDFASNFSDIPLTVPAKYSILVRGDRNGMAYSSVTSAVSGKTITLYAKPDKGYRLKEWQVVKGDITIGSDNTFVMPAKDVEVNPVFEAVPTYTIAVSPAQTDFGQKNGEYTAPEAKTVTVTNTGNQTVTLSKTDPADYTVGSLSASTLAPKASATFTVQPKAGLSAGTYQETVTVSTGNGTSAAETLLFKVNTTLTAAVTPAAATITGGGSQTLTAEPAGGSGNYTYEWYRDAEAAPFATTKEVTVTPDATAAYRVVVKDGVEEKQASATVTVEIVKFGIDFDANGGSGRMSQGSATAGQAFRLPQNGFTPPAGKQFRCWAIGSPAGAEVKAGESYLFPERMAVFAVWENVPAGSGTPSAGGTQQSSSTGTSESTQESAQTSIAASGGSAATPVTGDNSRTGLWIALLLLSGAALLGLSIGQKRRKHGGREN